MHKGAVRPGGRSRNLGAGGGLGRRRRLTRQTAANAAEACGFPSTAGAGHGDRHATSACLSDPAAAARKHRRGAAKCAEATRPPKRLRAHMRRAFANGWRALRRVRGLTDRRRRADDAPHRALRHASQDMATQWGAGAAAPRAHKLPSAMRKLRPPRRAREPERVRAAAAASKAAVRRATAHNGGANRRAAAIVADEIAQPGDHRAAHVARICSPATAVAFVPLARQAAR